MNESILTSIKKLLGIAEEYDCFDPDLILHINSVFMILNQLGVGPPEGFSITGSEETWGKFLPDEKKLQATKTFVHIKVRLLFDPPMSAAVLEAMKQMASELEWRLKEGAED